MKKAKDHPLDIILLDVFRKTGKKGGTTTAKRGKSFYKEIGTLGSKIRWQKKKEEGKSDSKNGDGLEKAGVV